MSRTARMLPLVASEARALVLPWAACLFAMFLPDLLRARPLLADTIRIAVSTMAYVLGAVGLGALSVGHDYTERTLGLLLSQPVRRQRIFLTKLGLLAAMQLTFVVVAYSRVFSSHPGTETGSARLVASLLPALGGLCVAPWLTMACRSPLAGMVFTLVMPGLLLLPGTLAWVWLGRPTNVAAFRIEWLWRGGLVLCAIGAVAGWRLFMRLEALDGRGADLHLPLWLTRRRAAGVAARPSPRHPVWRLVAKELRLQQMTLFLAGLYLLCLAAVVLVRPVLPGASMAFTVLGFFYALMLGLVTGSLASAEERQLGTHDWQVLLPIRASQQWAIKSAVVLGLVSVLAIGLPRAWMQFGLATGETWPDWWALSLTIPVAAGSLYVSSFSNSSIRALLVSLVAAFGDMMLILGAFGPIRSAGRDAGLFLLGALGPPENVDLSMLIRWHVGPWMHVLLAAGFVLLLLKLGSVNHRSADHPPSRILMQMLWVTAYSVAWTFVMGGVHLFWSFV